MNLRLLTRVGPVCALLALPVAVQAQQTASQGRNPVERAEQRLSKLHEALGITPDEGGPWDQYAQVARANARALSQLLTQRRTTLASMSATDNMQSLTDIATQHAQNMQRLSAAFQRLYAAMPPSQKRVADEVFRANSQRSRNR